MAYQTLDNFSASSDIEGLGMIFVYVATIVPIFIPLVLFALFIITGVGTFMFQEKFKGKGDIPASFAAASVLTALTAFIMTLVPGLMSGATGVLTLTITFVVAVISVIFLFISKE